MLIEKDGIYTLCVGESGARGPCIVCIGSSVGSDTGDALTCNGAIYDAEKHPKCVTGSGGCSKGTNDRRKGQWMRSVQPQP